VIGRLDADEIAVLAAARVHAFTGASIRGDFRSETRREA